MRLLKLSSNKKQFHEINFNQNGLNFILAIQKNNDKLENGKTYNGVGKSLVIKIIDFCLGGDKSNFKSFCDVLADWEFNLDISHNNSVYSIRRATNNPNFVYLNGKEMKIKEFNFFMGDICFEIPKDFTSISFRSLIPFFIRLNKKWYTFFDGRSAMYSEYQTLLNNGFLLGLNVNLIKDKYDNKSKIDEIKKLMKSFKKDEILKELFIGNINIDVKINDLEYQIGKLDKNLNNFKVADDYEEIQFRADNIRTELRKKMNNLTLVKNNISSITNSLEIKTNTNYQSIIQIYNEANIYFSDKLIKNLDDLNKFHDNLITNRKKRLLEQKNELEIANKNYETEIDSLKNELDKLIGYLGDHQALDVFVELNKKRSDLNQELKKIQDFKQMQSKFKKSENDIKRKLIEESIKTNDLLETENSHLTDFQHYFTNLVKKFYPNAITGLSIKNNEGDNSLRYSIDATIQSDSSDGINSVKIFCYDLSLLLYGQNHSVDFLFHDSRLFDGIDERQKATIFKILYSEINNSGKQYIATINQNQLQEIKNHLEPEIFKSIFSEPILSLTDENDEGKLLGFTVDIND